MRVTGKIFTLVLPVLLTAGEVFSEELDIREMNKAIVVDEVKAIFQPSQLKSENIKRIVDSKPYLKILKGSGDNSTLLYRCRFVKSRSIVDAVESMISSSGTVEEALEQNMIIVNDKHGKIPEIQDGLFALDIPSPQILVEAKIIEVQLNSGSERDLRLELTKKDIGDGITESFGYSLDAPSQNPLTGQGLNFDLSPYSKGWIGQAFKRVNLVTRWLESSRNAKILSAPNLIVDLGTTASIITGEDIPIQSSQVSSGTVSTSVEFRRIGVKLNITPLFINDNNVSVEVNPEVSSVTRFESFVQNGETVNNPVISIRNITTKLNVIDGEVIMLGGLFSSEEVESERKTPILSDIPFIGPIFTAKYKSRVRTQLIFILKISILDPMKSGEGIFFEAGNIARTINEFGDAVEKNRDMFPETLPLVVEEVKEEIEKVKDLVREQE